MTHGSNLSNDGEVTQPGCFENHRKQIMVASNDNVFVQLDAGRGINLNYIYFNHFINNLIKYLLIVFSQKTFDPQMAHQIIKTKVENSGKKN